MAYLPNIQENAQAALPVIPNNGNPGGVYNMPQLASAETPKQQQQNDTLAWMNPSPYMENINQLLQRQAQDIVDQKNNPYKKEQFQVVPTGEGWMFRPINDYDLPISRDNIHYMQYPQHNVENTTPDPNDVVIPIEYKDKLRNGQIY